MCKQYWSLLPSANISNSFRTRLGSPITYFVRTKGCPVSIRCNDIQNADSKYWLTDWPSERQKSKNWLHHEEKHGSTWIIWINHVIARQWLLKYVRLEHLLTVYQPEIRFLATHAIGYSIACTAGQALSKLLCNRCKNLLARDPRGKQKKIAPRYRFHWVHPHWNWN